MKVRAPNWSIPMKDLIEYQVYCEDNKISFAEFVRRAIAYAIEKEKVTL